MLKHCLVFGVFISIKNLFVSFSCQRGVVIASYTQSIPWPQEVTRPSGIHGSMEPDRKAAEDLSGIKQFTRALHKSEFRRTLYCWYKDVIGFSFIHSTLHISVLFCSFELKFSTKYRNPFCIKKCMEQTESNTNFKRLSNPVKVVYICLRTFNFNLDTSNRKIQYISLI